MSKCHHNLAETGGGGRYTLVVDFTTTYQFTQVYNKGVFWMVEEKILSNTYKSLRFMHFCGQQVAMN